MNEWIYFVAYSHENGFGNREIALNAPLTSYKTIAKLGEHLAAADGFDTPVAVLNFQLLSGPQSCARCGTAQV